MKLTNTVGKNCSSERKKSGSLPKLACFKPVKPMEFKRRKITNQKLPFSKRIEEDPEEKKKRIMSLKPSLKFHDFHTIQWLRHKYNDNIIEQSINTLLPDNGKPVIDENECEEEKKRRILMEWLEEYNKPINDKSKYININPKYFFNRRTFEKILKLKEIFLEFDEDGSRKMEIDEMREMFIQNHIDATMNELVTLFFKEKNIKEVKEKDINKLNLNFYHFMIFTLSKDQDFRLFMRKIKAKYKKQNIQESEESYLPMNFNLLLDYFITKGKERASIEVIEKAMEEMDKVINKKPKEEEREESRRREGKLETRKYDEIKEFDQQLEKINFTELINEFSKLFSINGLESKSKEDSHILAKSKQQSRVRSGLKSNLAKLINLDQGLTNTVAKVTTNSNPTGNEFGTEKEEEKREEGEGNEGEKEEGIEKIFTGIVSDDINKKTLFRMNVENFEKFHDLRLALEETRKQLKKTPLKKQVPKDKNNNDFLVENNRIKTEKLPKITLNINNRDYTAQKLSKGKKRIANDYVPYELLN